MFRTSHARASAATKRATTVHPPLFIRSSLFSSTHRIFPRSFRADVARDRRRFRRVAESAIRIRAYRARRLAEESHFTRLTDRSAPGIYVKVKLCRQIRQRQVESRVWFTVTHARRACVCVYVLSVYVYYLYTQSKLMPVYAATSFDTRYYYDYRLHLKMIENFA